MQNANRSIASKRPGVRYFQRIRAYSGVNAPSVNLNAKKNAPATRSKRPPLSFFESERPGAELACRLSEGNEPVSEPGKSVL